MCRYRHQMNYGCGHGHYFTNWAQWAACTNACYYCEVDDHEIVTCIRNAGECVACQDEQNEQDEQD
jgi:hypothetical protein